MNSLSNGLSLNSSTSSSSTSSSSTAPYLLVVEDSDEDFETLQRVLLKNCDVDVPVVRCCDGDEALDFLYHRGEFATQSRAHFPSLILLDLNLPGSDGREVLQTVKQDDRLKVIPITVFTTSSNPKDVESCYQYGANSYLVKPMDLQQMKTSVCRVLDYWFELMQLPNAVL